MEKINVTLEGDNVVPFNKREIIEISSEELLLHIPSATSEDLRSLADSCDSLCDFPHRDEYEYIFAIQPDHPSWLKEFPKKFRNIFQAAQKYAKDYEKENQATVYLLIMFRKSDLKS